MSNSLQDQLLKAGLVDRQKAKKTQADKRKASKRQRSGQGPASDQARLSVERARKEKAERDRELNSRRAEEAKQREIASQVRQLIEVHRVRDTEGDLAFNFADGGKLKRIYVTADVQRRLSRGQLAVARLGTGYELVPGETAEKIRARDAATVVLWNRESPGDDQDDPYRDYQVPDDLMW